PDVAEVRPTRSAPGRLWVDKASAVGTVVSGRIVDLSPRLIAGRLPAADADEVLVSELTLYEVGVRDDSQLEAMLGQPVRLEVGAVRTAQPMALLRALTGRSPADRLSLGQSRALEKLTAELPESLDKFDL